MTTLPANWEDGEGKPEIHASDQNALETQVNTNTAAIAANAAAIGTKADDSAVVHDTGNETIAGTKTFSSPVVIPTGTAANNAVTKAQLDAVSGGGGGGSGPVDTDALPEGTANLYYTTARAALKANDTDVVHDTGTETVAGVKTFSSSPIVPTATTSTQVVNKGQMDTAVAGVSAGAAPGLTWLDERKNFRVIPKNRHDFSDEADTSTPGTTEDTGGTIENITGVGTGAAPKIASGAWTNSPTAAGNVATYREFHVTKPVTRIGAWIKFDSLSGARTGNGGVFTIAVTNGHISVGDTAYRIGVHLVIGPASWQLQTYNNSTASFATITSGTYTTLTKDNTTIYEVEMYRWGGQIGILLPNGTVVGPTTASSNMANWSVASDGSGWGFIEAFCNSGSTDNLVRVVRYWHDTGAQPKLFG